MPAAQRESDFGLNAGRVLSLRANPKPPVMLRLIRNSWMGSFIPTFLKACVFFEPGMRLWVPSAAAMPALQQEPELGLRTPRFAH